MTYKTERFVIIAARMAVFAVGVAAIFDNYPAAFLAGIILAVVAVTANVEIND